MNILLVDDDVNCLEDLVSALAPAGHQCRSFADPAAALKAYEKNSFDVVITDMKMPGLSGIEVLKRVRALNPEARVIINTGYGDVETAISAVNNGAYAFFGKPIDLNDLMETLEKIDRELTDRVRVKNEHARLAMEYARLKQAYLDLRKLVKDKTI